MTRGARDAVRTGHAGRIDAQQIALDQLSTSAHSLRSNLASRLEALLEHLERLEPDDPAFPRIRALLADLTPES